MNTSTTKPGSQVDPWLDPIEESSKKLDSTLSDYAAFILVGPGLLSFILFKTVLFERMFT